MKRRTFAWGVALLAVPALFAGMVGVIPAANAQTAISPHGSGKYWIYFRDKGPAAASGPSHPSVAGSGAVPNPSPADLSARTLRRRAKTLSAFEIVQPEDFPLFEPYVDALRSLGISVVTRSRWMNAVSAHLPPDALASVRSLDFVRDVTSVRSVKFRIGRPEPGAGPALPETDADPRKWVSPGVPADTFPAAGEVPISRREHSMPFSDLPNYGASFAQADAIRVPAVHAMGITGRDVVVGLLDSGFRWKAHRSLAGMRVLGEYDFISGDGTTANQPGDPPGQDSHGTLVLSVLGGYAPGALIGPAFGAEFLLAKTEYVPTETQIEEDYWAAGIEWLEANGADVVNSSVGYDVFDGGSGYSWANGDFDGETSVVAKAAQRAAALGVTLCVSMGNEGNGDGIEGTMLTPADADTAISVGSASTDGVLAGSSSTGPTSDGRIKPDVVAPGVSIYSASTGGFDSYFYQTGTSLASPLTAGTAALLLSARPELAPSQLRDLLRESADTARVQNFSTFPNNFTGWGYVDAFGALLGSGLFFSNRPGIVTGTAGAEVSVGVVSRAGVRPGSVFLWYVEEGLLDPVPDTLAMTLDSAFFASGAPPMPTSGRYVATIPPHAAGTRIAFGITAADSAGDSYSSPSPFYYNYWVFAYGEDSVREPADVPVTFRLLQNYPNPFNDETAISFDLPAAGTVKVEVFNVGGGRVATLFDGYLAAGAAGSRAPIAFRAGGLPSGMYLCRLTGPGGSSAVKMLLLK